MGALRRSRRHAASSHFNLHLDHESQPSREKSTALLLQRIAARPVASEPVIVTGDFNVGESNSACACWWGQEGRPAGQPQARPRRPSSTRSAPCIATQQDVGTFTAFAFGRTTGDKIDYVLVQPGTTVLDASIVRTAGRTGLSVGSLPGDRPDPLPTAAGGH